MSNAKKVTIFLSRRITLMRNEHEPLALEAGRNDNVDADVAAHPFVKYHTLESASIAAEDVDAMQARIAELETLLAQKENVEAGEKAEGGKGGPALRAARARIAELETLVAQKDADMQALVDSMAKK